jgi:hypothetical protein
LRAAKRHQPDQPEAGPERTADSGSDRGLAGIAVAIPAMGWSNAPAGVLPGRCRRGPGPGSTCVYRAEAPLPGAFQR